MITEQAPAKINLTLEVLGERPDGFHEIRSVLQTIDLGDTLYFNEAERNAATGDLPGWSGEKSLVTQAVDLMRLEAGVAEGVSVRVEKRIPLLAGLGGDSSDAAAVLRGLDRLWGLRLADARLREMAAGLGSDVAFFLRGGTALAEGRGEIVTPLPAPPERWLALIVPAINAGPGKTGRMYAALRRPHFTEGKITGRLGEALRKNQAIDETMLFNTFENVADESYPGLATYREHLIKMGATRVHLAGSGPALYAMFEEKETAERLHEACRGQGIQVYLVRTP